MFQVSKYVFLFEPKLINISQHYFRNNYLLRPCGSVYKGLRFISILCSSFILEFKYVVTIRQCKLVRPST